MKKIIFNILILSIIILAGCQTQTTLDNIPISIPKERSVAEQTTTHVTSDCKAMTDEIARNFCYADLAKAQKNISICDDKINNVNTRDICYQRVAIAKQDFSLCKSISEANQNSGIGSTCYSEVAKLKKDPALCEDLPDEGQYDCLLKDECYLGAATGKLDISICKKISYSVTKDTCYLNVAIGKKDSTVCSNIVRISSSERCHSLRQS